MSKYLIGIDEAGRGPLAGPVSLGAFMVPIDFDFGLIDGVKDSKKLAEKKRNEWVARFAAMQESGLLRYEVAFSSAQMIDEKGIVPAIRDALSRALMALEAVPEECDIRLDGSLFAPKEFINQKTIIGGDASEPVISAASIAAKVARDALMVQLAQTYPHYGFEIHKGYGTKKHSEAIREHGLSSEHRRSFCRAYLA